MIVVYFFYLGWTSLKAMGIFHSSNLTIPMLGMVFYIIKDFRYLSLLPKPILYITIFHLIYFLLFDDKDFDSLKYVLAKLSFILFFSIFLQKNNHSYIINLYKNILIYCLILLIAGVFLGTYTLGRFEGVLQNANNLSSVAVFVWIIYSQIFLVKKVSS